MFLFLRYEDLNEHLQKPIKGSQYLEFLSFSVLSKLKCMRPVGTSKLMINSCLPSILLVCQCNYRLHYDVVIMLKYRSFLISNGFLLNGVGSQYGILTNFDCFTFKKNKNSYAVVWQVKGVTNTSENSKVWTEFGNIYFKLYIWCIAVCIWLLEEDSYKQINQDNKFAVG